MAGSNMLVLLGKTCMPNSSSGRFIQHLLSPKRLNETFDYNSKESRGKLNHDI